MEHQPSAFTPKEVFLASGVGIHKEKLFSFEEALRKARIARLNLVEVSSIIPPGCKLISQQQGLAKLKSGQITYTVLSVNQTEEYGRIITASVGLAMPKDSTKYGYLSEHHSFGQTKKQSAQYAEELAANMLATIQGFDMDEDVNWDKRKELWRIREQIVVTKSIAAKAVGKGNGHWTTVVAAAVFAS